MQYAPPCDVAKLLPETEQELGKKVKHSAVMMAIRRYADTLEERNLQMKFDHDSE